MNKLILIGLLVGFIGLTSCNVDEVLNPNSPTVESFENGATLADLQLLANGLQAVIREDMEFHFWTTNMLGREYYDLRGTDPRYTTELLGRNGGALDNAGFLTTRTYFGRYRSVRNANLLKTAVGNTVATLSDSQSNALLGYANTIIGYELLLEATRQFENGIRIDVEDVENLGPFSSGYQDALAQIQGILNEGFGQLSGSDEDVVFPLAGMDIPASDTQALAQFNRALAARIALYQGNTSDALTALNASFFDLAGDLNTGAYYSFGGATGNDRANPLFYVPGVDNYMAHPEFIADATAGDTRVAAKVMDTGAPIEIDDLSGQYLVTLYESNSSPASIIRNEELILIYAEANIESNSDEAVNAINIIRNAAGIGDYTGGTGSAELLDEVLYQRRYSLFGEGHRWIDLRRTGNIGRIALDRDGDIVHTQFPRPASELE